MAVIIGLAMLALILYPIIGFLSGLFSQMRRTPPRVRVHVRRGRRRRRYW